MLKTNTHCYGYGPINLPRPCTYTLFACLCTNDISEATCHILLSLSASLCMHISPGQAQPTLEACFPEYESCWSTFCTGSDSRSSVSRTKVPRTRQDPLSQLCIFCIIGQPHDILVEHSRSFLAVGRTFREPSYTSLLCPRTEYLSFDLATVAIVPHVPCTPLGSISLGFRPNRLPRCHL